MRVIEGIVHWWEDELLIRSVGRRLEDSRDSGQTFDVIGRFPLGAVRNLAALFPIGRRLARSNVKHCIRLHQNLFVAFAGTGIFQVNLESRRIRQTARIVGSRPLRICFDGRSVYYGEYRRNLERSPISLWRSDDLGETWNPVYRFEGVRHIHGVFIDPIDQSIWMTTGDTDQESAIWQADPDLTSIEPIVQGSQQARAIDLLFAQDCLYFGTDAPHEANHIYRLDRRTRSVESVQATAGPVFHAASIAGNHYFTTAREPGSVNTSDECEVWKGDSLGNWNRLGHFKKDRWPMIFEYGQVLLPSGSGKPGEIWLSPYATQNDQQSLLLAIDAQ